MVFLPALVGALVGAVGSMIGRAMIAGGVGFATFKGVDLAIGSMKQLVITSMSGGGQIFSLVGFIWLDKGLTLIFSCFVAALSLKLTNGALKRIAFK
ncbi:DUF2523 domain-containing protein [Massilia sp. H-1]|nr:DUF2523 domain-containing protein [Massilia sp. H-1]